MKKTRSPKPVTPLSAASWTAKAMAKRRKVVPETELPEFIFFCDETGNSGRKFFDPEQPIYAEGGWIIPAGRVADARTIVAEAERHAHFGPLTKGSRLKRSPAGLAYIADVATQLSAFARPFIYMVEKRYAVCAKAVETFFDPAYNPSVHPAETRHPEMRQARAELFYASDPALLQQFAGAYREQDAGGIVETGKEWRDFFLEQGNVPFALGIDAALPGLEDDLATEFATITSSRLPRGYDTLNLPALVRVFQLIDEALPNAAILHDECASFESVYTHCFNRFRRANPDRIDFPDGRSHSIGFRGLTSLQYGRSEAEPLLRAADYLVAACVEYARVTWNREQPGRELRACMAQMLGPINRGARQRTRGDRSVPQLAEMFASEEWTHRVFSRQFRKPAPRRIGRGKAERREE